MLVGGRSHTFRVSVSQTFMVLSNELDTNIPVSCGYHCTVSTLNLCTCRLDLHRKQSHNLTIHIKIRKYHTAIQWSLDHCEAEGSHTDLPTVQITLQEYLSFLLLFSKSQITITPSDPPDNILECKTGQ